MKEATTILTRAAGAGANDVVMQLVVVTSLASINFTAGDLTITE
jgi:hypothetical protein